MKTFNLFTLAVAAALLSGCAAGRNGLALATVGPAPGRRGEGDAARGALIVYSAYLTSADFNMRDRDRQEYSDYTILAADGDLVKSVHNNNGTIFQGPVSVELPRGRYTVAARANGYGLIHVPVVIEPGRRTILHLEGGGPWPNRAELTEANSVHLPDGRVIGWKAADDF